MSEDLSKPEKSLKEPEKDNKKYINLIKYLFSP